MRLEKHAISQRAYVSRKTRNETDAAAWRDHRNQRQREYRERKKLARDAAKKLEQPPTPPPDIIPMDDEKKYVNLTRPYHNNSLSLIITHHRCSINLWCLGPTPISMWNRQLSLRFSMSRLFAWKCHRRGKYLCMKYISCEYCFHVRRKF